MSGADQPLFSVIIPTRNRSSACAEALQSVLHQSFDDFEVILVDDGSEDEHARHYRELAAASSGTATLLTLPRSERGHGPGYARNFGAAPAHGIYLAFLDDDDRWTDPEHLRRVAGVIASSAQPVDLLLGGQQAFRDGVSVTGPTWIEDLPQRLGSKPDSAGAYTVTAAELSASPTHCHLNTLIVSRSLFAELGGLDAGLRYEEDRDFYLRAIDRARMIKYLPDIVSRHNIPDPVAKVSASTSEPELSKRLCQLRVFDKAVLFSTHAELRRSAMRQRAYILKHIANEAAGIGRFDCAAYYARQALMARFTFGWLALTLWFALRRHLIALGFGTAGALGAGSGEARDTPPADAPRIIGRTG
jgi:glycosyltransferase involved in cell wall biosynthesis